MDIKVSVIVPAYNVERYLHKCVRSLLDQTYKNVEIILVDDESTDHCSQICDEFAASYPRILTPFVTKLSWYHLRKK